MNVLLEYIDLLAEPSNIAPLQPQLSDTCTKSLLSSWTVFETSYPKRPKILKLCLRVSYNSGIILSKMFTYYSQNYAGIIGAGLTVDHLAKSVVLFQATCYTPIVSNIVSL